jgi:hypothetical protein
MNDFFLRYWIPKNGLYSKFLWESNDFSKAVISEEKHPFELKLSKYHKGHEIYYRKNFQTEIHCCGFLKYPEICWKLSKMAITRVEKSNGTNSFRVFIHTMSPIYEQNVSSNKDYQLDGFPRQFDLLFLYWEFKQKW